KLGRIIQTDTVCTKIHWIADQDFKRTGCEDNIRVGAEIGSFIKELTRVQNDGITYIPGNDYTICCGEKDTTTTFWSVSTCHASRGCGCCYCIICRYATRI